MPRGLIALRRGVAVVVQNTLNALAAASPYEAFDSVTTRRHRLAQAAGPLRVALANAAYSWIELVDHRLQHRQNREPEDFGFVFATSLCFIPLDA